MSVADYLLVEEEDANNLDWATALAREERIEQWPWPGREGIEQ